MVSGGTANTSFEFDAISWFELIGDALPTSSKSESDPLGLAAVQTALPNHQPEDNPQSSFVSLVGSIGSAVSEAFSFVGKGAKEISSVISNLPPGLIESVIAIL
jgi:hypothetical protein